MSIKHTILPNGLRVITDTVPSVGSVAVGVWADVGTRHEDLQFNGVAHMVEHMMFKGTPSRSAARIAEEIENVGGQVNAYTSREVTAYYVHLLKDDLKLAVNILSDIMQYPTMPDEECERERHVILQEIGMTYDTPDDIIFDDYQETAYPAQALGAPILGTADIIREMKRDTLYAHINRFYTPQCLVISAAGNIEHDEFVGMVEKSFNDLPIGTKHEIQKAEYRGGDHRAEKDLEQTHLIVGFQGLSRQDDDFFAATTLSTILGGGMSSRLFQEIREKRGLVYSVYSMHQAYQDDGQFMIYAGTGPKDVVELMPVLCDEVAKTVNEHVSEEELKRAKAQARASLMMARESMLRRANQQATHLIHYGDVLDIEARLQKIEALDLNDIQKVARRIFGSSPTIAARGPLTSLEPRDRTVSRLAA